MIKKYRTWIHLWHDGGANHCAITKVIVKDGKSRTLDSFFFRPCLASATRLAEIVYNSVMRGEGKIYPSVIGIGWSWQKEA